MSKQLSILFAGGGTAGHLLPALATEEALSKKLSNQSSVHLQSTYLATRTGAERKILERSKANFCFVPKTDLPRKFGVGLFTFLPRLIYALLRTLPVARRADVVVGFGGYVALPAYLAAYIARKPLIIHEANALPGLANRFGRHLASRALSNFQIPGWEVRDVIGLPIRDSIWKIGALASSDRKRAQEKARTNFGLASDVKTILIFGGSLGAAKLNDALELSLDRIMERGYQVLHSVGEGKSAPPRKFGYQPLPFISEMDQAYLAADLVISRSGAGTCAEILATGVPAILIPLNIGNGEQMLNAQEVEKIGIARIIANQNLDDLSLLSAIDELMSKSPVAVPARGSAAEALAEIIIELSKAR